MIGPRDWADRRCVEDSGVVMLEGWAPRVRRETLREFADDRGLVMTARAPTSGDRPPTLLDNPAAVAAGADCMTFYRTPPYGSWDPSPVVFVSFGLFFAMILADAGYALTLGLILLFTWRRIGSSGTGRRLRRLMLFMVAASAGYGILVGSYFGVGPGDSWLATLHLLDIADQGQQMPLAIAVGGLHLMSANLLYAWHLRATPRGLGYVGWAGVIAGGLTVGAGVLGLGPARPIEIAGGVLFAAGAVLVLLFSSPEPFPPRTLRGWAGRVGRGLTQIPRLSNVFGDVLSYLRLFALGLASARLAQTFNELAHRAGTVEGIGLLFALLVLVFGHAVNLALGIMGGVVHGLRLNCIEFFNWGLPDEGYAFRPFSKKATGSSRPEVA